MSLIGSSIFHIVALCHRPRPWPARTRSITLSSRRHRQYVALHFYVASRLRFIAQPGAYPQRLNQTRLWDGANVDTGGIWDPHIFDRGKQLIQLR